MRFPWVNTRSWDSAEVRTCSWGRFTEMSTGLGFYVFNTHFDHRGETARQQSAKLIMERVVDRKYPNEPVVITGDFNSGERSVAMRFLQGKGDIDGVENPEPLVDTFRVLYPDADVVGTYNDYKDKRNGAKIDYVLANPGVEVSEAVIDYYLDEDGNFPSDHWPISGVATLPTDASGM